MSRRPKHPKKDSLLVAKIHGERLSDAERYVDTMVK